MWIKSWVATEESLHKMALVKVVNLASIWRDNGQVKRLNNVGFLHRGCPPEMVMDQGRVVLDACQGCIYNGGSRVIQMVAKHQRQTSWMMVAVSHSDK